MENRSVRRIELARPAWALCVVFALLACGACVRNGRLTVDDELLWTSVRYYAGGTGLANRTSGPSAESIRVLHIENPGPAAELALSLMGPDAGRFSIVDAAAIPELIEAGTSIDVELRMQTDNSRLGPAPAQDDGATVLEAELKLSSGKDEAIVRLHGLVLTYAEFEPTLGQVLDAFGHYDSGIPLSIRNDANPNPPSLPGGAPGRDEILAPAYAPANQNKPVILRPLARFSPPGIVHFGWYAAENVDRLHEVGSLDEARDPETSDQARMLNPPLAAGNVRFDPAGPFNIWIQPAAAEALTGPPRIRIFAMRDGEGNLIPDTFLVAAEEASNGDYQDYVFLLGNAKPLEPYP